jgi:hypothetical protein
MGDHRRPLGAGLGRRGGLDPLGCPPASPGEGNPAGEIAGEPPRWRSGVEPVGARCPGDGDANSRRRRRRRLLEDLREEKWRGVVHASGGGESTVVATMACWQPAKMAIGHRGSGCSTGRERFDAGEAKGAP